LASFFHQADDVYAHAGTRKSFCSSAWPWISWKMRKRHNSHAFSLQTWVPSTLKLWMIDHVKIDVLQTKQLVARLPNATR
jgi:hypothetical protein